MPWYLFLSLKYLFPTRRRLSFFACVSILGVSLGILVLMVVQSVMNGLGAEIYQKLQDLNGHIRIEGAGIMYDNDKLLSIIKQRPELEKVAPYAQGIVMVQYQGRPAFPQIRSVLRPEEEVVPVASFLKERDGQALRDDGLWVSSQLAKSLGVRVGSSLELYTPLMLECLKAGEILLAQEYTVQGIFHSGWNPVDANTLLCTLPTLQELYGLETGIHGLALRLKDPRQLDTFLNTLKPLLTRYNTTYGSKLHALSWMELDPDLLFLLKVEKTTMFFIILFIIVIASFSIASSLTTIIVKKTREIGLLLALGATPMQVAFCFAFQGFLVGCMGTLLGFALAFIGLHYRNTLTHALVRWTHSEAALLKYYAFMDIPVAYQLKDICIIAASGIGLATVAAALAALKILKLKPVDALRSE